MSDRPFITARGFASALFFVAMAAGWGGIGLMSLDYFRDVPHPFILEKLPLPREEAFIFALKAHVATALFALPACLLLLSARFRASALNAHRWIGRATGVVVLAALVPSGFVLALTARGGLAGTIGFMLSGLIVAVAMVHAVGRARAGDLAAHRHAARHVVAQLSVAVTSRAMLLGFGLAGAHGDDAYLVALWVPVIGSALVVEAMEPRARSLGAKARGWSVAFAGAVMALVLVAATLFAIPRHTSGTERPADAPAGAGALLTEHLLIPYRRAVVGRPSYSRVPNPDQVEARVLDETPLHDPTGAAFVRFAVDHLFVRAESENWVRDAFVGCIYPETGAIYISASGISGPHYTPALIIRRHRERAPAHACVEAERKASAE